MKHAIRIIIMTAMTELVIMSILGFEHATIDIVGAIILIGTIPILIGVAFLHGIERFFGGTPKYVIAAIGLLPAAFFIFVAAFIQVRGVGNDYSMEVMSSGVVWSMAWVFTSSIADA